MNREEIYHGKRISLCRDSYEIDGEIKQCEIVLHPGAVVILPVMKEKKLLLVKQWRHAIQRTTLEFPAGTLEKREEPLDCAQRELREETGFASKKIIPLGGFFSTPGFTNEFLYLFLALDLFPSPLPCEESIDLVDLSAEELDVMIENQKIQDAKTIAGFYRYGQWLKTHS